MTLVPPVNIIYFVEYMRDGAEKTLGEFEQLVLLALLRLAGKAYGVSIHAEIERRALRQVSVSAVYTTLERLEQQGLVSSRVGEPTPERGGRRKKFFALTAAGSEALAQSYRTFKGMVAGLERQLGKL